MEMTTSVLGGSFKKMWDERGRVDTKPLVREKEWPESWKVGGC